MMPTQIFAAMNSDPRILQTAFRWDVVNWSRAFELWEPALAQPGPLRVLEVGGREGGLSSLAANYGHQVVCSDLDNPESIAAPLHRAQKVAELITYEAIDATAIPYRDAFDVILFKSILGGIGRDNHPEKQQQAIQSMYNALKPGGYLLFAENLRGSAMHRQLRATFQPWGKSWRYLTQKEMAELLSPFSHKEMRTTGVLGTLGRSESQRNMLGKIDQSIVARICPGSWHYIIYGYARK
jgi:SAM-dependent methyltransferase